MIPEDAKKILDTLSSFCNENEGNKLNRWLAIPLINTIKADLQEILQRDAYVPPKNEEAEVGFGDNKQSEKDIIDEK